MGFRGMADRLAGGVWQEVREIKGDSPRSVLQSQGGQGTGTLDRG